MRPSLVSPAGPTSAASRRPSPLGQQPRAKAPLPRPPRPGQALLRAVSRPPPQTASRPHRPKPSGAPLPPLQPTGASARAPPPAEVSGAGAAGKAPPPPRPTSARPVRRRAGLTPGRWVRREAVPLLCGSGVRPDGRRYIEAGGRSWAQARRPVRSLSAPPARLTTALGSHQPSDAPPLRGVRGGPRAKGALVKETRGEQSLKGARAGEQREAGRGRLPSACEQSARAGPERACGHLERRGDCVAVAEAKAGGGEGRGGRARRALGSSCERLCGQRDPLSTVRAVSSVTDLGCPGQDVHAAVGPIQVHVPEGRVLRPDPGSGQRREDGECGSVSAPSPTPTVLSVFFLAACSPPRQALNPA